MVDFFVKEGSSLAVLVFTVADVNGAPVDLTGTTREYKVWSAEPGTDELLAIAPDILVPVPANGQVRVEWALGDWAVGRAGRYYGRGKITFPSADPIIVPTVGWHQIFVGEMGPAA